MCLCPSTCASMPCEHHRYQSRLAANRNTRPGRGGCELGGLRVSRCRSFARLQTESFLFYRPEVAFPRIYSLRHSDVLHFPRVASQVPSPERHSYHPRLKYQDPQFKKHEAPVVSRILECKSLLLFTLGKMLSLSALPSATVLSRNI